MGRRERKLDFDAVYQAHAQTVARWAARLGGPGVDVEDITQEVFLVADRRLREFRHESQRRDVAVQHHREDRRERSPSQAHPPLVVALDAERGR